MKLTRVPLITHLIKKLRNAFGMLVCSKDFYMRILALVYNAFAMPDILALTSFLNMFTTTDKKFQSVWVFCEVFLIYTQMG